MAFNFGGTTSFGQANASPFGQQQANPSSGGAFGQTASPFGAKNTAPQQSTGFGGGAFGAPQQNTSFGGASNAFGAKPQQATNTFGAAGSSPFGTAGASASPFGQASANSTSAFGSGFGQQQAASSFGGAGGFGATTNTTTGTFGQPAKPMFGQNAAAPANTGFGATSNTGFGATTPAFGGGGAFGSAANTASSPFGSGSSAFGAKPATTSAFGSTGFGQQQPAAGAFGASSAFGATTTPSTGGAFGSASPFGSAGAATSAFGQQQQQTAGAFGAMGGNMQNIQVGTGTPSYQSTLALDTGGNNSNARFMTITAMNQYQHKSHEELRYEDYLKKTNPELAKQVAAQSMPTASSMPSTTTGAFGAPAAPAASGFGFGSTTSSGGFGAPAAASPSPFGATTTSAFGTPGGNTFGAQQQTTPSTGFSFGGNAGAATPQTNSSGFSFGGNTAGGFGAAATPIATGFGATTTGGFGQTPTTGAFGAAPATATTPGFGGFGSSTPAAGGFGQPAATTTPTTPGGFGFGTSTPAANSGGFGGFGAASTTPGTASTGFSFGAAAGTPAKPAGSMFGATASGGGFGAAAAPTTSLFGGAATAQPSTFGESGAAAPASTGFSFGGAPGAAAKPAGSLFGATTPGGGFGAAPTTGTTTSLFGGNAATTSFSTAGTTSAFGGGLGGGSMFSAGAQPGATGSSLFGGSASTGFGGAASTTLQQPATLGGGFGASTSSFGTPGSTPASNFGQQPQQQQQQQLIAGFNNNPYGAGSIGAGLVEQQVQAALALSVTNNGIGGKGGSIGVGLSRRDATEAAGISPGFGSKKYYKTPLSRRYTPSGGTRLRPRGTTTPIASTFSSSPAVSVLVSSVSKSRGKSKLFDDEQILSPDVFRSKQVKKLVIDKTLHENIQPQDDYRGEEESKENVDSSLKPNIKLRLMDTGEIMTHRRDTYETIYDLKKAVINQYQKLHPNSSRYHQLKDPNVLLIILRGKCLQNEEKVIQLSLNDSSILDVCIQDQSTLPTSTGLLTSPASTLSKKNNQLILAPTSSIPSPADNIAPPPTTTSTTPFLSYADYYKSSTQHQVIDKEDEGYPNNLNVPILTKPGYYTIPDALTMEKMTDEELSKVEDFTVGCTDIGQVQWLSLTDVRNLDLDSIVEFHPKEIIVYPDEENKPDEGQELNKPAIVQLEQIFPSNGNKKKAGYAEKVKKKTIQMDATFIEYSVESGIWKFRTEHFSRYGLDSEDEDDEATAETSSSHKNNKRKKGDDNDDTAANALYLALPTEEPVVSKSTKRRALVSKRFSSQLSYRLGMDSNQLNSLRASLLPPSASAHSKKMSTCDNTIHPKTATNVAMSEPAEREAKAVAQPSQSYHDKENRDEQTLTRESVVSTSSCSQLILDIPSSSIRPLAQLSIPSNEPMMKIIQQSAATIPMFKPLGIQSDTQRLAPEQKSSSFALYQEQQQSMNGSNNNNKTTYDRALYMGRSFRCGWGPNGELVHPGKIVRRQLSTGPEIQTYPQAFGQRHFVQIQNPFSQNIRSHEPRKKHLEALLNIHLMTTKAMTTKTLALIDDHAHENESGVERVSMPYFELPHASELIQCLHEYIDMSKKYQSTMEERQASQTWELINALWGQEHSFSTGSHADDDASSSTDERIRTNYVVAPVIDSGEEESMQTFASLDLRREAISQWFQRTIQARASSSLPKSDPRSKGDPTTCLRDIFDCLSRFEIENACELALEHGHLRLATLVAQIQCYEDEPFRALIQEQLCEWTSTRAQVNPEILRIYQLLAGQHLDDIVAVPPTNRQAGQEDDHCWITTLGRMVWYSRGPGQPFAPVFQNFYESRQQQQHHNWPRYFQQALATTTVDHEHQSTFQNSTNNTNTPEDTLMQLMKLYCRSSDSSLVETLSPDGYNEDMLNVALAWHMNSFLRRMGMALSREDDIQLTFNYLAQLESSDMWHWAIYVALTLPDARLRESTVASILTRHYEYTITDEHPDNLVMLPRDPHQVMRQFLLDDLMLPPQVLEQTSAVFAAYHFDIKAEIGHAIAARDLDRAHWSVVLKLAPRCIFQHDLEILARVLTHLESIHLHDRVIGQWHQYGGCYLEYIRLTSKNPLWSEEADHLLEDQLLSRLLRLVEQLKHWTPYESQQAQGEEGSPFEKGDQQPTQQLYWRTEAEKNLERVSIASMLTSVTERAIKIQSYLAHQELEEQRGTGGPPTILSPEFLTQLCQYQYTTQSTDVFGEQLQSQCLTEVCTSFIAWRNVPAQAV